MSQFGEEPRLPESTRGVGQKTAFVVAIFFYIAALFCVGALYYYNGELGSDSPIVASFGASIVFFVGAGIVLHVIGKVSLPDLSIKRD
ncbi:MAG: hemerythrin family protein [Gammaproteobacteria bacterium]|nr:hemerythrin family protein [Gammaproteobacteria bacterium]